MKFFKFLKRITDRALPLLFWLLLMLAFDSPAMTVLTVAAAITHELGHIAVISFISGGRLTVPRAVISGLRIAPGRMLSYKEEALVAIGGPAINLLVFISLIPFFSSEYVFTFALLNLLTAISNLIPIYGYDGYRILRAVISKFSTPDFSERLLSSASLLFSSFAVFTSLFFILKIGEGYWIFTVFFVILVKDILKMHTGESDG